jgi:hypothetical protein
MRGTGQVLASALLFSSSTLAYTPEAYNPATSQEAIAQQQNNDPNRKWCHVREIPNPKGSGWIDADRDAMMQGCINQCPHYNDRNNTHSATCGFAGGDAPPFEYKKGMLRLYSHGRCLLVNSVIDADLVQRCQRQSYRENPDTALHLRRCVHQGDRDRLCRRSPSYWRCKTYFLDMNR